MTIEEYRSDVRKLPCPACLVPSGEKCVRLPEPGSADRVFFLPGYVDYVHDERSMAHHEAQLAELRAS